MYQDGLVPDVWNNRNQKNRLDGERHDALVDIDDLTSSISSSGKVWRDSRELNAENADLRFSAVGSLGQITACPAGRGDGIKYLLSATTNIRIEINQNTCQQF